MCLSICLNRFRNVDSGCEQNSCNIYALLCHRHAVNITTYSANVPQVVYPCKPESRIKSESENLNLKQVDA